MLVMDEYGNEPPPVEKSDAQVRRDFIRSARMRRDEAIARARAEYIRERTWLRTATVFPNKRGLWAASVPVSGDTP